MTSPEKHGAKPPLVHGRQGKWNLKDLTGQVFGRLTVLRRHHINHSHGNAQWVVHCSCGTVKVVRSCHLIKGHTITCGSSCKDKKEETARSTRSRDKFIAHMHARYSGAAFRRGIFWDLTHEQVDALLSGRCFYCGVEPCSRNKTQRGNAGFYLYNGIDRLANHLGYFLENCVSCCGTCNIAKQDMSLHEFMTWIARVMEYSRHANG